MSKTIKLSDREASILQEALEQFTEDSEERQCSPERIAILDRIHQMLD